MEIFSRILLCKVQEFSIFKFHPKCKELQLTHLCFADNLMIFARADLHSIGVIQADITEFNQHAGIS